MAIAFARMQILSRNAGHSTTARFRYIARLDETRMRGDLLAGPITLIPAGTHADLTGGALWTRNEDVARRSDSIVGFELVLALPGFDELALQHACTLVEQFCTGMIVANGLGATIAIHGPHARHIAQAEAEINTEQAESPSLAELVDATLNWPHAHIIGTPRALGPDGFSLRRSNLLEPLVRGTGANRTVLCAVPWGPIWTQYQNAALASSQSTQRVRLVAPHRGRHIGPARAMALLESDLDQGLIPLDQRPRVNREIEARNRQSFEELVGVAPDEAVFRRADLRNLLSRYLDHHAELERRTDLYLDKIRAVPLLDPVTDEATCWFTASSTLARCSAIASRAHSLSQQARAAPIQGSVSRLVQRLERDPALVGAVEDVAKGTGIVTVEMGDLGSVLPDLDEIFRHASCSALHVGHKAMTLASLGRRPAKIVIPGQFERKIGNGAVAILDRADALPLGDLQDLLQVLEERQGQLVVIRRPHTLPFPRNVLVDRIASFGPVHRIGSWAAPALIERQALVDRDLGTLVDVLRAGRFRLFADEAAMLDYAARALRGGHAPRLASVRENIATRLAEVAGLDALPYVGNDPNSSNIVMAFPGHHARGSLFGWLPQNRTALLIDLSRVPTLAALFADAALRAQDMRLPFAAAWSGQPSQAMEHSASQFSLAPAVITLYSTHFDRLFDTAGESGRKSGQTTKENRRPYSQTVGDGMERVYPLQVATIGREEAEDQLGAWGTAPVPGLRF